MAEGTGRATFAPAVFYQDPVAALDWLEKAFSFERTMVITDDDGNIGHAEMGLGNGTGYIMVGSEWEERTKSPKSLAGKNTQNVHVQLTSDVDAHCARARSGGATIVQEPEDQFYGDRVYRALDLEGHVWTFGQNIRKVSREEAEKASGLKIEGWI
ncbi:MAG: VOC family protein [Dehalococcoidia bacterium]